MEEHVKSPRRHVLGAIASAVAGLLVSSLGRRERPAKQAAKPATSDAAATGVVASSSPATSPRLVVKPARHSVKRHG